MKGKRTGLIVASVAWSITTPAAAQDAVASLRSSYEVLCAASAIADLPPDMQRVQRQNCEQIRRDLQTMGGASTNGPSVTTDPMAGPLQAYERKNPPGSYNSMPRGASTTINRSSRAYTPRKAPQKASAAARR